MARPRTRCRTSLARRSKRNKIEVGAIGLVPSSPTRRHSTGGRRAVMFSSKVRLEIFAKQVRDLVAACLMVLAPARSDLYRSHEGREPAGLFPVEARVDTVENTGTIRVAAPGGVHHFGRLYARDVDSLTVHVDDGPFRAAGKNERFETVRKLLERASGPLLEKPAFVVVDREVGRLFDESEQLFTRKHRKSLARVEHERNAQLCELARVLQHALAPVGRNDREVRVELRRYFVQMRIIHRSGMEGRDLVVVQVGGDERLGGERIGHLSHAILLDAELLEPLEVQQGVVADGGHRQWIGAEKLQVVGYIAGATAELPPQLGNEEGHIQDVDLFGQDVLPETAAEYHDVVVRDRAADQDAHKKRGTWNDESREFADGTGRLAGLFTRAFPCSSAVDFLATCCWEREA